MTRFLDDILRQPAALASTVRFLGDGARRQLDAAVAALRRADHVYLTGIGSSYHAVIGAAPFFHEASWSVGVQDASEMLHFGSFPPNSAVVLVSRSGQSVEVLQLLAEGVRLILWSFDRHLREK